MPERSPCPPERIVFDPERGVRVCADTGEVIETQVIGDEAEWRAYTPEEKARRTRVGSPISYSKPNLGVDVFMSPREGGRRLRGLGRRIESIRVQRGLRMGRSVSSVEKNINQALKIIDDIVGRLNLPYSVKEEAARLYREAANKGLTRGRSIYSMVAATIYAACRKHKIPVTLDEIAQMFDMGEAPAKREIARNYRLLVRDLGLEIPVIDPENFVHRIASALNLPEYVTVEAIRIVRRVRKLGLTAGKDPSGLAAAAVYLAALKHGLRKTQKEVAQIAGVTEVTVRNRYKEIDRVLRMEAGEQGG